MTPYHVQGEFVGVEAVEEMNGFEGPGEAVPLIVDDVEEVVGDRERYTPGRGVVRKVALKKRRIRQHVGFQR